VAQGLWVPMVSLVLTATMVTVVPLDLMDHREDRVATVHLVRLDYQDLQASPGHRGQLVHLDQTDRTEVLVTRAAQLTVPVSRDSKVLRDPQVHPDHLATVAAQAQMAL